MTLLAAKAYDPAAAVTKTCASALVMTALDTTNLRLTFQAPASGMVSVRMKSVVHGATTFPQILLGVLESTTVRGREVPDAMLSGTALATTFMPISALFPVVGLTPGATYNWDAAYGVETGVTNAAIKYGGPNNGTANDAFGAFIFEVHSL